jgi:hypothetical protein
VIPKVVSLSCMVLYKNSNRKKDIPIFIHDIFVISVRGTNPASLLFGKMIIFMKIQNAAFLNTEISLEPQFWAHVLFTLCLFVCA